MAPSVVGAEEPAVSAALMVGEGPPRVGVVEPKRRAMEAKA